MDLVTLSYLVGFLNFHGLLTLYLNNYSNERVEIEREINHQFYDIIEAEDWTIKKNP